MINTTEEQTPEDILLEERDNKRIESISSLEYFGRMGNYFERKILQLSNRTEEKIGKINRTLFDLKEELRPSLETIEKLDNLTNHVDNVIWNELNILNTRTVDLERIEHLCKKIENSFKEDTSLESMNKFKEEYNALSYKVDMTLQLLDQMNEKISQLDAASKANSKA